MKKQFILIILITFFFFIFSTVPIADIPAGYYDSAQGLCHDSLSQELRTIISNGYVFHTYGDARAEMYGYIDNNSGWVMCVYTGESFNLGVGGWPDDYELNCEHTYCQSWFEYDPGDMKTDLHHLFPTQPNVNSSRSNRPLDDVTVVISTWGSGDYISYNGKNSSNKNVFEPADQHKGDAARAILYFIVRYDRDLQQDIFNATTVNIDILPTLRQWHQQDPVSQKEINRNDDIYDYQNNRNPFVDHPEYVEYVWGSCQSETDPPQFNGIKTAVPTGNTGELYLTWDSANDLSTPITYNIYISTLTGGQNFASPDYSTQNLFYKITGLINGTTYFMVVRAEDAWGNEDTNLIEKSGTPTNSSVPDTFPPVFNGVSNVIDLKTGRTLKLIWEAAEDAENSTPITYNIYYTIYSGNQHFDSPSFSTTNNYIIIDNLNKDQTLYFVVRAEDYFGNEDKNIKELTGTPTKIGEDNISIDNEIKIYPNPVFGNETNLIIKSADITSIEIFSINGTKIAHIGSNINLTSDNHAVWNTAGVASGIYIYVLKNDSGKTYVGKIAVIK